jgi:cytochrome c553
MSTRISIYHEDATRFAPILLLVIAMTAGCAGAGGNAAQTATTPRPIPQIGDPQVRDALVTSCGDCHSNKPVTTWQARISPSYEFARSDALVALNFSRWDEYSEKTRTTDKALIAKVIEDNSMPPFDYKMLHPAAKLSPEEKQALLQWASSGTQAEEPR